MTVTMSMSSTLSKVYPASFRAACRRCRGIRGNAACRNPRGDVKDATLDDSDFGEFEVGDVVAEVEVAPELDAS
ncbi:hypothetical protein HETIRDRAFT_441292 [Heterobasidion irregulare TC 32-1]|uniref:Uncharacterized protein n=1 Tax=Heterobasidion irregulare (strain TC 32-1) TaxID=747525 RepID=W4K0Q9_HETIT|nr:uncharacterized protein HETIRDRAFT_441292 [Heterobasidion irregulare TC 32-1]ETW79284.1 hypothetical protein HETIRDRAFT_441292 [Heterobasidion irregulare TC 32-1]